MRFIWVILALFGFPSHLAAAEDVCEIIYSPIPHINAVEATGKTRLQKVFALTTSEQEAFFRALLPVTEAFFDGAPYVRATLSGVSGHGLVTGGYEGITTPSISMKVRLNSSIEDKMAAMQKIAAALAFFYIQDSVLVICPDDGQVNDTDSYSFDLVDRGDVSFFSAKNAQLFFGLMIGAFNGPQDLGYTFYEKRGVFSTLVSLGNLDRDQKVLADIAVTLKHLSQGRVDIGLIRHKVDIAFPHNDWANSPQGSGFKAIMAGEFSEENLSRYRQKFLNLIDQHTRSAVD